MAKIKIIEAEVVPVCPSCKKNLSAINQTSKGVLVNKTIFTCPYCRVVLGIGLDIPG